MNRQQLAMTLVLRSLGLDVRVDTFDDRLILQKAVYLAQAAGVKLGYYFRWYIRGPYCPALASDAFVVADEPEDVVDAIVGEHSLDGKSQTKLETVKELVPEGDTSEVASRLELLASVHFLVCRKQSPSRPQEIRDKLVAFGKDFSNKDIEVALDELEARGLLGHDAENDQ